MPSASDRADCAENSDTSAAPPSSQSPPRPFDPHSPSPPSTHSPRSDAPPVETATAMSPASDPASPPADLPPISTPACLHPYRTSHATPLHPETASSQTAAPSPLPHSIGPPEQSQSAASGFAPSEPSHSSAQLLSPPVHNDATPAP